MTLFHDVQAIRFRPYTTAERDGQTQVENLLILNVETSQFEIYLGTPPNGQWYGVLRLNLDGTITPTHHGSFAGDDLHSEYARTQAPEQISASWFMKSGGSVRGGWGDEPKGEIVFGVKTTTGAPTHSASAGVPCWVMPDNDLYINEDGGTNWTKFVRADTLYSSKEIIFSSISDTPATGDIVDGFPNGIKLPDSDERGTLTAVSAWATCDDANKGTGTNTIDIEVDSTQAFASPTVIFTIALGTASFAEDVTPQTWDPDTDKYIRAKWNTANASPPKKVRVGVVLKERAEAF